MKIGIQAGHQNIKNNIDPGLRGSTGAGDEAKWTPLMRDALSKKLIEKGFQVLLFDANANSDKNVDQDFDLFLAIHWDADVYGRGGGFADWPDPSVDDVNVKSKAIAQTINDTYFSLTGIEYHPERSNDNTKFYYMWRALTAKTPCVLIECGTNNKDNLPNRIDEVSTALAKGIFKAFGITDQVIASDDEVKELKGQIDSLTVVNNTLKQQIEILKNKLISIKNIINS